MNLVLIEFQKIDLTTQRPLIPVTGRPYRRPSTLLNRYLSTHNQFSIFESILVLGYHASGSIFRIFTSLFPRITTCCIRIVVRILHAFLLGCKNQCILFHFNILLFIPLILFIALKPFFISPHFSIRCAGSIKFIMPNQFISAFQFMVIRYTFSVSEILFTRIYISHIKEKHHRICLIINAIRSRILNLHRQHKSHILFPFILY